MGVSERKPFSPRHLHSRPLFKFLILGRWLMTGDMVDKEPTLEARDQTRRAVHNDIAPIADVSRWPDSGVSAKCRTQYEDLS